MKSDPLNETHILMNSRVQPSLVSLIYQSQPGRGIVRAEGGTGALLYFGDHVYIVSCNHVVQGFMAAPQTAIVIPVNTEIKLDSSHIDAWKGLPDPHDVACMKLKDGIGISQFICLIEKDFDTSPVDWASHGALLYGYPGETFRTLSSSNDIGFRGFSLVGHWKKKNTDTIRDEFEYAPTSEVELVGSDKMPHPGGLSGSPVWKFEITPNRVGKFPLIKIVAIENAWIETKRVYLATPVEHLLKLVADLK